MTGTSSPTLSDLALWDEFVRLMDGVLRQANTHAANAQALFDGSRHNVPLSKDATESYNAEARQLVSRIAQATFKVGVLHERAMAHQARRVTDLPHSQTIHISGGRRIDDPPILLTLRDVGRASYAPAVGVESEGGL